MLEKLRLVEERYMEMEERAAQPDFYADPKAATKLLKEQKQLEPIIKAYRAYKAAEQAMAEARELMDAGDPELKALCQEEFSAAKQDCERLEHELKILLLPRDPNDDKSVIMEIRGGVGGEESALFAHSLYRMYTMYAQRRGILRHAVSADKKRRLDIPCRQTVEQTLGQGAARPVVKRQRHPFFVLRRPHRRG